MSAPCAWVYDDGGRAAAGYKGQAGDCVTRAIAIATGRPYQEVYDGLREEIAGTRLRRKSKRRGNTPRDGVPKLIIRRHMEKLGWEWTPTMAIGQGCKVHLRKDELPPGRLVVTVSRHLCAVIDGVVRDTHDPTRDGTRCVYGYWAEAGP
jgi:hypothetical protein